MKTSSWMVFCRAGILLLAVILDYYFFNSIIVGFDLESTIFVGILLSFLLNFLYFLIEDREI
jgi:hypothetical protein